MNKEKKSRNYMSDEYNTIIEHKKEIKKIMDESFEIGVFRTEDPNLISEIDKSVSRLAARKLSKINGKDEDEILENLIQYFGKDFCSNLFSQIMQISYTIAKRIYEIKQNKQ